MAELLPDESRSHAVARVGFAVLGGAAVGVAVGAAAGLATARMNDSVAFGSDAFVLAAWLAALFALPCILVSAFVSAVTAAEPSRKKLELVGSGAASAAVVVLAFYACHTWLASRLWTSDGNPRREQLDLAAALIATSIWMFAQLRPRSRLLGSRVGVVVFWLALFVAGASFALTAVPTERVVVPGPDASRLAAPSRDQRVILLGLDGADWRRIDALVAQHRLPNFERLLAGGLRAPLRTNQPTWSPIVWTTIATGAREAQHGIHDFTELFVPGLDGGVQRTYAKLGEPALLPSGLALGWLARWLVHDDVLDEWPINSRQRRAKALWNILGECGISVGVASWFASFPAEPVEGWMVADNDPWHAFELDDKLDRVRPADVGLTFPPDLLPELTGALPKIPEAERRDAHLAMTSPLYVDLSPTDRERLANDGDTLALAASIQGGDRFAASTGLFVWQAKSPRFLAVYLRAIDNLSHRMHPYPGVIDRTYEWTDALLGSYLDALDAHTTLIVASDHGWDYPPSERLGHNHAPDGILVLYGAGVATRTDFATQPTVFDIAPTVLALFGLPASIGMPGRTWSEAFVETNGAGDPAPPAGFHLERVPSWGSYTPPPPILNVAPSESQAETVERLRALGYAE